MHRMKYGSEVLSVAISECKEFCNKTNTAVTASITIITADVSSTIADSTHNTVTMAEVALHLLRLLLLLRGSL